MRYPHVPGALAWRSFFFCMLTILLSSAADRVAATVYYISSSTGNDGNNGTSSGTPWATFNNVNVLTLAAGDQVLLKRGDTWNQELHLTGDGTVGNYIILGPYGSGNRPIISRTDLANDICVKIESPSYWQISDLDCRNAKLGIYLRYDTSGGNNDVQITSCNFQGMTDTTAEPANHNYEFAWSNGIFLGGHAWYPYEQANILNGLTIKFCTFTQCAAGFGTGWYYPAIYKSRITNLIMEDNVAFNCYNGVMQLMSIDGGHAYRCDSIGGGGIDIWTGTTLGFAQNCKNFTIDDCEFAYCDRARSADGCGFDFEGNNETMTFSNNVIHDNDGAAVLLLSTDGPNQGITIANCTFYNNALDPWNSQINCEIMNGNGSNTGVLSGLGLYRKNTTNAWYSTKNNWFGYTNTNPRQGEFTSVYNRQRWWNFDSAGNFEGWGSFNQWLNPTVSGGTLSGTSTGTDPYGYSGNTWVSSSSYPYAWVRMSCNSGTAAQLFYITESDTIWDGNKSIWFTTTADGAMHDYFVDMRSTFHKGVVTQVRLDPTGNNGAAYAIDFVRLTNSTSLGQSAPPTPTPLPTISTFTSVAADDGQVLESGQGTNVGGSNNNSNTTIIVGDDSSNRAYRGIFSFDTSALPDGATIRQATIKVTRTTMTNVPWNVLGGWNSLIVDIAKPYFGTSASLANGDWQAASSASDVGRLLIAFEDGLTVMTNLSASGLAQINKTGKTQIRLRFSSSTNANSVAENVTFASGSHGTAAYRPVLEVQY